MVEYCESVIRKIQEERNPQLVDEIVDESILGVKEKSHTTNKYIINMIVMLQNSSKETTDATGQCNMRTAIRRFKEYQRQDYGVLF